MSEANRMFSFVGPRSNPVGGACPYKCRYCWAIIQSKRFPKLQDKYSGPPTINYHAMYRRFLTQPLVFYGSMRDMFSDDVPAELLKEVLENIDGNAAEPFFLTKNAKRYYLLRAMLPATAILGVTVETNQYPTWKHEFSHAPVPMDRLEWLAQIRKSMRAYVSQNATNENEFMKPRTLMVSIEPSLKFDERFLAMLKRIMPDFVAIGLDNYRHHMPEPTLAETEQLIADLEKAGIKVYRKTIRKAWDEE